MRITSRAAGLLALAVVAITCTDAPTGPGGSRPGYNAARLALAPNFSPTALRAWGALETMGISVTEVRIRLRTADGAVARDTTIQFGGADTLRIQIPVEIQGTEQTFSALIEMRDPTGLVLFAQTQDVVARAASLPPGTPPVITLEYVGPGATARTITITPSDLTVQPGQSPVLTAAGADAAGNPVTDLLLAWSSSDTTLATVTSAGRVATVRGTGRRGAVVITAVTPTGLSGTARLTMLPAAARLALISGGAQTGIAGQALSQPFIVELQGVDGGPIPGAAVTFRAVTVGGSVGTASATTDAAGRASTTLALGATAGAYVFEAASGTITPVTITATATAGAAAKLLLLTPAPDTILVGATIPPVRARLADAAGNVVRTAGVLVRLKGTPPAPDTSAYRDSTVTDTAGIASFIVPPYRGRAGLLSLSFASAGLDSVTQSIVARPGPAAGLLIVQQPSATATSGQPLVRQPVVQLVDVGDNAVPGVVTVTAAALGGATLSGDTAVTSDASGRAAFAALTLGGPTGSYNLRFASGTLTGAVSSAIALQGVTPPVDNGTTSLSPRLDTLTSIGDTRQLAAVKHDAQNQVVAGSWTWESRTPGVATVGQEGLVTALRDGSSWIVATEAAGSRDSSLIVVQQRVATINVSPATRSLYTGGQLTYTASAVDGRGNAMQTQPSFTWSSTQPSVASIDAATGVVTARAIGSTQIRAASGAAVGVASLTVLSPITRIDVTYDSAGAAAPDEYTMTSLGERRSYRAIARDTLLNPIDGVTFTWSSTNASVAPIDSAAPTTARVVSAANGVTSIRATAQGVTGAATLAVSQVLASIELAPTSLVVAVDGQGTLLARGKDAMGRYIPGGSFAYQSAAPSIATVGATSGVVTGVSIGSTTVTASSGGITSNAATVTVSNSGPATISFGRDTIGIGRGSSQSVPVYLSRPSAQVPVTVTLAVQDTIAFWSSSTLTIPAGQTSANATLNGRAAGTTRVSAIDGSGTYAGDTAVVAVQATLRFASSSYSMNATDQRGTQVVMSDPSPAGGTYVTFAYGTSGRAAVSPDPAFIPAGQLAADVVIRGLAAGSTTVTPGAAGVSGTASTVTVSAAVLNMPYATIRLGEGQYDPNQYVQVPNPPFTPLTVTLASTDSTIATAPPSVTIPTTSYYSYFPVSARGRGTARIVASAPGWTPDTLSVLSTTPMVTICCGTTLNSTSPARNVTVYATDSLRSAHLRISSLAVRLSSSDPAVLQVLDTLVTIDAGAYYTSAGRVIPTGAGGTAWIRASASGHGTDSVQFTVTGPALSFGYTTSRLGVGQEDQSLYVQIPNAIASALTVTLTGSDTAAVGTGETVVIPAGSYYAYFTARGKALGRSTIVATAPGYSPDTAVTTVTTPRLKATGGSTIAAYSTYSANAYAADSTGNVHVRTTPLVVTLRSTDPSVLTVDSMITIPAGSYYATTAAAVTAVGPGTARIIATAPGHLADSSTWTVQPAKLGLSWSSYVIGARQHRNPNDFYVATPGSRGVPVNVTLTSRQPATVALSTNGVTIPAGSYYQYFSFSGLVPGRDTIIATAPGYDPDTAFVTVTTPALGVTGLPATATTTDPPRTLTLYANDSTGYSHYANDTVVVRAVSSDTSVLRPGEPFVRIVRNAYYATPTVLFVGPGTATITYSDSAGTGYTPVTTNAVTVTGPALAIAGSNPATLGMRQRTFAGEYYVYAPNTVGTPLTVNLTSTGTRVATVPASVTIPAGSYYAYFEISAQDTIGTIQIQASATGYTAAAVNVRVTAPRFMLSTNTSQYTTSAPAQLTVYASDETDDLHPVTEDVTVTLASSAPGVASIDSVTVTIRAGEYYSTAAKWTPGTVGTAQLTASDPRSAYYRYGTGTVTVNVIQPTASLSFNAMSLGLGQYSDEVVYLPEYAQAEVRVPIDHAAVARTTTPASVTIPAGGYQQYFRIAGASTGPDTLTVSPAGHVPAKGIVAVGLGRLDPLTGWPTSLRVGDSVQVTLHTRDPQQGIRAVVAATTFDLAANGNVAFVSGGATSAVIRSATVPADQQYVQFWLKGVAGGTGSATITNSSYSTYTNSLTVTP